MKAGNGQISSIFTSAVDVGFLGIWATAAINVMLITHCVIGAQFMIAFYKVEAQLTVSH